ncbi:DUF6233 domain-containing protein [Streptomyces sp. SJL17-4]|uniref:DUF6233 domain-containing protein n=1 Tax=Streptomyces sp. SJL17-4 TaxID=2967224 RepID=UPI0030D431C4
MWLDAPQQVRAIPGDYGSVPAVRLPRPSLVAEILGERRPSGWVLQSLERGQGIAHAPDCVEAPQGATALSLERTLTLAEQPSVRLCSLCGASAELSPLLLGFENGFDS